jgi:hypothetical protein
LSRGHIPSAQAPMTATGSVNHTASPSAVMDSEAIALPRGLRLRSLADLGDYRDLLVAQDAEEHVTAEPLGLDGLLDVLAEAEQDLAQTLAEDASARRTAEELLAQHDQAQEQARLAQSASERARTLVARTQSLLDGAFTDEARERASIVLEQARRVADGAEREAHRAKSEAEFLAERPEIRRLLEERTARETAEQADHERAERLALLARAVESARALADQRRFDEALTILTPLARECPDEPQLLAFVERLERDAQARRLSVAQHALWQVRRQFRQVPTEAIDFTGLDDELARQLFGLWLRAARRLGIPDLQRHSPEPHRGALLRPLDSTGTFEVISAIGGSRPKKGQVVLAGELAGLRPLGEETR